MSTIKLGDTPAEGRKPDLPFRAFKITNADQYARAVAQTYGLRPDGKGGYKSDFGWVPVITPKHDTEGRCFQLECWVHYWLRIGMRKRAVTAVRTVLGRWQDFGVPAEFPWLFDPNETMRVQVPVIPSGILSDAGLRIGGKEHPLTPEQRAAFASRMKTMVRQ